MPTASTETPETGAEVETPDEDWVAVIQGRYCLAYQDEECRVCYEVCPEMHAITLEDDQYPMVQQPRCTGCRLCLEACPAKEEAIRMIPRVT